MRKTFLPLIIGISCLGAVSVITPRERRPVVDADNALFLETVRVPPVEEIDTHVMKRGETLSGVLARYSFAGQDLADALLALREHQDPRRMTEGAEVTVHRWAATKAPRSVELRLNADSTVILAKNEIGWNGKLSVVPVVVDTVYVAGEISSTLYTSLVLDETLNLPVAERVQLASALGSIYAYTIDFSREIQPGDSYRISYEREARPDGTARSRRILIGEVVTHGKQINAVYFKRGSIEGYYTKEGESLREGFRRSPLEFTRVTSNFTWSRYHPILGIYRAHLGTDYGASSGTPVHAVADGTVVSRSFDRGYGNMVVLRHFNGLTTRYAHLRSFGSNVKAGARVKQDQVIGYVGSTGLATAAHLHFELRKDGKAVDSRKIKLPGSPPIPREYKAEFKAIVNERMALLEEAISQPKMAQAPNGPARAGVL